jgi:hypothetical protein
LSIGGDAVGMIEKYLKVHDYNVEEVKFWWRWAKQVDKPIFHKKPTPQTCPADIKHKDYIVSVTVTIISLSFDEHLV